MDMLAAGSAWLTGQLQAAAGATIVYTRGSQGLELTATVGRSTFEAMGQSGVVERWESRDYLLKADDLPFGDPQRGDKITEVQAGVTVTYEVSSPRGVPEWHYGDAYRTIVRVHTVQTESGGTYLTTEDGDILVV